MSDRIADALEAAGLGPHEAQRKQALVAATTAALERRRSGTRAAPGPVRHYYVPGRVEVLGKHTDYAGGRSLLCAAERGFVLSVAPRQDPLVHVADVVHRGEATFRLTPDQAPCPHWHNYPATVVRRIVRNFEPPLEGVDVAFASDLPRASGMSSSTAFIIGVFLAIADRNALADRDVWRREIGSLESLAAYLGAIENGSTFGALTGDRGVGTQGGSQDHTAILCARAGRLVAYRFDPLRHEATVGLGDRTFVIGASGVTASKAGEHREHYNRAVRTLHALLRLWEAHVGEAPPTLGALLESGQPTLERLRALIDQAQDRDFPAAVLRNRLEQFVLEALTVVPAATRALAEGDIRRFGALVDESQRAAEQWLENQIPETVALARLARSIGADAASAFGAGFGGSVWALVPTVEASRFLPAWRSAYTAEFPSHASRAEFFPTRPGPGVIRL